MSSDATPHGDLIVTDDDEDLDDGMCPDSGEHPADYCHKYNCPNYIQYLQSLAPWGTSGRGLKGWA